VALAQPSAFRVEKVRIEAVIHLSNGVSVAGDFFVAQASPTLFGQERVAELLNCESGFVPFDVREPGGARTALLNRDHIVTVAVRDPEARRVPGYDLATSRRLSVLMSDGQQILGTVRVYRPEGRDRLSDWSRHGDRFRYIESSDATFIVNVTHIVEAREVFER
jgi:hypothetical protein